MAAREEEVPGPVRLVRLASRSVATALHVLEGEGVRLRAMALTYISLFALVPALVVVFSVVQAFTGTERIALALHRFLLENVVVGAGEELQPHLLRFVSNAHAAGAGVVGGLLLVWSALTLFSNVDRAVNDTWGLHRGRPLRQQAIVYWMGLTLGPLLLAGSLTVASTARGWLAGTGLRFLGVGASVLLTCAFFTVLYAIVPVTKVRLLPALAGGLAAGVSFELAKWGYATVVGKIFRYHAIYGSVAAVPIFIFWLFVSWSILLFGARLAYVVQNLDAVLAGAPHPGSRTGREILAGRVALEVARTFDRGERPPDEAEVASRLGAPPDDVEDLVALLRKAEILVAVAEGGLVPARPLERLTLLDVRRAIVGEDLPGGRGAVAEEVRRVEGRAAEELAAVTLRDLCDREARPSSPAPLASAAGAQPRP